MSDRRHPRSNSTYGQAGVGTSESDGWPVPKPIQTNPTTAVIPIQCPVADGSLGNPQLTWASGLSASKTSKLASLRPFRDDPPAGERCSHAL